MKKRYPGINPNISEWKGQEITDFQEELLSKVNANISEKWFYTHIKSTNESLPRIDILNILSKYAGYANWDDFIYQNQPEQVHSYPVTRSSRYFLIVPAIALGVALLFYVLFYLFNTRDYEFTFVDGNTREVIRSGNIEVVLLSNVESPVQYPVDSTGIFHLRTDQSRISLVVSSPYYRTDTIVRIVKKLNKKEIVTLQPDDYALMIHYFSGMKVDDWEKRRVRLDSMIADDAMICQAIAGKDSRGVAMFNKQEFIDRLTMPTGNLKNLEITGTKMKDGRISVLRFRIREEGK